MASTSVPGLAESAIAVLEAHNEDIDDIEGQRAARERLEEFSRALRKWWWDKKNNEPKPIPYVVVSGKKLKLHKDFLKAFLEAREKDKLKEVWTRVERDLKKGFLLEVSG